MQRPIFGILLAGVACRAASFSPAINPTVAPAPGATWLAPLRLGAEARPWHVTIRGVRDSVDRLLGDKMVTQSVNAPAEAEEILIVSAWRLPLVSLDSISMAPQGLRPIREVLAYNGFTRRYQYSGNHVWGTVQHADSAPRQFDRVFPEPLFAFSEVDLLVRAVPFRAGWSVVVPLFSESDEEVEHDTITVLASRQARHGDRDEPAWLIRFADPAIISTYTVLAGTREILSIETEQRRTHAIVRYRVYVTDVGGTHRSLRATVRS